jgi:phi13 family phage major tail protein
MSRYPVFAPLDESTNTYGEGVFIGKMIDCDVQDATSEASLYADDALQIYVNDYKETTITLNVSTLPIAAAAAMFGRTVNGNQITYNKDDRAAPGGFGYIKARYNEHNVSEYIVVWHYKAKFASPGDKATTRGDSVTFNTPSISGKAMARDDGNYRDEWIFPAPAQAIAKLKSLANVSSNTVSAPWIFPASGAVPADTLVTIASDNAQAAIYYTTDGSDPTTASDLFVEAFEVSAPTTVKAIAVAGGKTSVVASAQYTII